MATNTMTRAEWADFIRRNPQWGNESYESYLRRVGGPSGGAGHSSAPNDSGPPVQDPSGVPEHLGELGGEMMAWAQEAWGQQYENMMLVFNDLRAYAGTFMGWSEADRARWENVFKPIEDALVADAETYNTVNKQELEAGRAASEVTKAFGAQRENSRRALEGMGVDRSTTRGQAMDGEIRAQQAAAAAAAANNARQYVEQTGHQRMLEAAALGTDTVNRAITEGQTAGQMQQAAGSISNTAFANVPGLINAPLGYYELGEDARQFDLGFGLDQDQLWWDNYWKDKTRRDANDVAGDNVTGGIIATLPDIIDAYNNSNPPPTGDTTGTGTTPQQPTTGNPPASPASPAPPTAERQAITPYATPEGKSTTGSGVGNTQRHRNPFYQQQPTQSFAMGGPVQGGQAIPVGPWQAGFSLDTRSDGAVTGLPHATGDQSLILAQEGEEVISKDVMEWEGRKKFLAMRDKAREEMAEEEQKNPPQFKQIPSGVMA